MTRGCLFVSDSKTTPADSLPHSTSPVVISIFQGTCCHSTKNGMPQMSRFDGPHPHLRLPNAFRARYLSSPPPPPANPQPMEDPHFLEPCLWHRFYGDSYGAFVPPLSLSISRLCPTLLFRGNGIFLSPGWRLGKERGGPVFLIPQLSAKTQLDRNGTSSANLKKNKPEGLAIDSIPPPLCPTSTRVVGKCRSPKRVGLAEWDWVFECLSFWCFWIFCVCEFLMCLVFWVFAISLDAAH